MCGAVGAHILRPPPRPRVLRFRRFRANAGHVLCRIQVYYTQMASPASLRRRLAQLLDEHRRLLDVAFEATPLWRGIVHEARRRCGKPTCHCVEGKPHVSTILSDRSASRQRNLALPDKTLERFRTMTESYRRVRRKRARIVVLQREMLEIFDALEAARRQGAIKRYGGALTKRR